MMVKKSTNSNKTTSKPWNIHNKTTIYNVGNLGFGLGWTQKCGGDKSVNRIKHAIDLFIISNMLL
jgi:hypothetical protein